MHNITEVAIYMAVGAGVLSLLVVGSTAFAIYSNRKRVNIREALFAPRVKGKDREPEHTDDRQEHLFAGARH